MARTSLARRPCPIARALDQLGDGWSLLIMRDVFLGAHRFAELQARVGVAPNILTNRLALLTRRALLERRSYSLKPPRFEYVLTEKGEEVLPVLLTISAWGSKWLSPGGAAWQLVHPQTRAAIEPVVIDRVSHNELLAGQVAVIAGPGASKSLRAQLERPKTFEARSQR